MQNEYSVAILCGGRSARMGQDKAEMRVQAGGPRMADRLLAAFSGCGERILSLRDETQLPDLGESACQMTPALIRVIDPVAGIGPLAGIVAALRVSRAAWVFVTAVDMPYMDKAFADELFSYNAQRNRQDSVAEKHPRCIPDVIVPVGPDGHVQPMSAFYNIRALPVLEACIRDNTYSLWKCLQKLQVVRVPVGVLQDGERKLTNWNRPGDVRLPQRFPGEMQAPE